MKKQHKSESEKRHIFSLYEEEKYGAHENAVITLFAWRQALFEKYKEIS